MNVAEQKTVSNLINPHYVSVESNDHSSNTMMSPAEPARKRLKSSREETCAYMDTRFLLPTFNVCERLFSIADYSLIDRHMSISPLHFEEQMFLFSNADLWGIKEVNELVVKQNARNQVR